MKETRFNLQCDWQGLLEWHGVKDKRAIIDCVVFEVDAYRNQPWWRKLFNLLPKWELESAVNKEVGNETVQF